MKQQPRRRFRSAIWPLPLLALVLIASVRSTLEFGELVGSSGDNRSLNSQSAPRGMMHRSARSLHEKHPRKASTSISVLVKQWIQLLPSQKLELLNFAIDHANTPGLFVLIAELAYAGAALEPDPAIALQMASAVHAGGNLHPMLAIFVLDHVQHVCPHDIVRDYAREQAGHLRARLLALGR